MENTKKLTGKDLINVGIYTAMTLVIFFVVGLLTALPVVYPFLFIIWPIVCGIPMLIWERLELPGILAAWMPLLYAGVMSCGVAYTLQIIAQKNADPTVASLLLSLESVFSVLAGWMILHQSLSIRELFGCVLMFGAIILAQLPEKTKA